MKSACFALFAAPLVLLDGCGRRKPADPLAGLSEVEQRWMVPLGSLFDHAATTAAAEAPDQEGRPANLSIWRANAG